MESLLGAGTEALAQKAKGVGRNKCWQGWEIVGYRDGVRSKGPNLAELGVFWRHVAQPGRKCALGEASAHNMPLRALEREDRELKRAGEILRSCVRRSAYVAQADLDRRPPYELLGSSNTQRLELRFTGVLISGVSCMNNRV